MTVTHIRRKQSLHTKRIHLRAAQEGDLDDMFDMFKDEEVMRYWSCPPHTQKSQTKKYLQSMLASPINGILDFTIVLSNPNNSPRTRPKVIGKAGIWDPSNCEIGFLLHRSFWGQGFMTEALQALLPHLWAQGVERIVADVDPRNESSIRLLMGFGFVETGRAERTFETGLGWCDSVYFALERPRGLS